MSEYLTPNPHTQNLLATAPNLTASEWSECVAAALTQTRESVAAPELSHYLSANVEKYPRWLMALILAGLSVVALGALFVSAGKQLAAGDLVLSNVLDHTVRVSEFWVGAGLIVLILLGEVGALIFGLSAGLLGRTNHARAVLRAFMVGCAGIALLANVTMTAAYPSHEALVFQWFVTLLAPTTVLGVGLVLENMLLSNLELRRAQLEKFEAARAEYLALQKAPDLEAPTVYRNFLAQQVIERLTQKTLTPSGQRGVAYKQFTAMLNEHPELEDALVVREFTRHMRDRSFLMPAPTTETTFVDTNFYRFPPSTN